MSDSYAFIGDIHGALPPLVGAVDRAQDVAENRLSCRIRGSFPAGEGRAVAAEAEQGQGDEWLG